MENLDIKDKDITFKAYSEERVMDSYKDYCEDLQDLVNAFNAALEKCRLIDPKGYVVAEILFKGDKYSRRLISDKEIDYKDIFDLELKSYRPSKRSTDLD